MSEPLPVAWIVDRDSGDEPEVFATEELARANACLGLADTHVRGLYRRSQLATARAEGRQAGLIMACAFRSEGRREGIEWVGKQFCANVSQEWVADQLRALADKGET